MSEHRSERQRARSGANDSDERLREEQTALIRALVLAGGGVAGIAWELGVLRGLADVAPDLADSLISADLIVGTSAGSAVAAQITSGTDLETLYQAQLSTESAEIEVAVDIEALFARLGAATAGADSPRELRQRIGALALETDTIDEAARRVAVAARLPVTSWPEQRVLLPAVDAESGELVVFDRQSGVALVDAVAASCAVPGVWPPVTIDGRRYVDGGVRSGSNADLAAGADRVLVITPTLPGVVTLGAALDDELAQLGASHVVYADEDSVAAFGANPLSPATRGPAARAGRAIGAAQAEAVRGFWQG